MENNQKNPHPLVTLIALAEEMRAAQTAEDFYAADCQTAEKAFDDTLAAYKQLMMPNPIGPMQQGHFFALDSNCRELIRSIDQLLLNEVEIIDEIRETLTILADFGMPAQPQWRADKRLESLADYPKSFFDDFDKGNEQ